MQNLHVTYSELSIYAISPEVPHVHGLSSTTVFSTEKNPPISELMQFKPMLFKERLYLVSHVVLPSTSLLSNFLCADWSFVFLCRNVY